MAIHSKDFDINRVLMLSRTATWLQVSGTFVLLALIYALSRAFYNLYFHPISHFPGPFWGRLTDFHKLWYTATKRSHLVLDRYHKKYGPVVRIAPNLLSVSDSKYLNDIYHRRVDKTDFYSTGVLGDNPPPFQTIKHEDHARKRKRVASSFTMSNIKGLEHLMDERIQEMTDLMTPYADRGECLDYSEWARWFAYDLITHLAFGAPIGFIKAQRDVDDLIEHFHRMAPLAGLISALPWLTNPILQSKLGKKYLFPKPGDNTGTGQIMAYRDNLLKDRFENPLASQKGDFLDNILRSKNPDGSTISIEDVKAECFVLFVAAPDTTSAFFCPFMELVLKTPGVKEKLVAEIADFERLGKLSFPVATYEETSAMPYLMACIHETHRHTPSTPMLLPRLADAHHQFDIESKHVPIGTELASNPWIIGRDKKVYGEDCYSFRPERWIDASEDELKEMHRVNMSWGYGTRVCLGKNIAQMETQKLCSQLFRLFDIKHAPGKPSMKTENWGIAVYGDQWLDIQRRVPAQKEESV